MKACLVHLLVLNSCEATRFDREPVQAALPDGIYLLVDSHLDS